MIEGEFPKIALGDLLSDDRGISVGVMYPGEHDAVGVPLLRSGDLANDRINLSPPYRISPVVHAEYGRTELSGGELLMTLVGDVGRCAVAPPGISGWNVARAISVMRFKHAEDAHFVRFSIKSPAIRHLIDVWSNTTVQQTLNLKEIKRLPIPWPSLPERRNIVGILGGLDDKIDLNCRMNQTLEAMARAIFKDWFVDFGPTRAKMEGRAPYLAPEIWKLFPDRLGDEGQPEGWQDGTLSKVATLNPESWSQSNYPEYIDYVDLANTKWGVIDAIGRHQRTCAPSRAQRILRMGDTIVGTVRPGNGSYALIGKDGLTGSTGFAMLRPVSAIYREFVYLAVTSSGNIERLAHLADGGAYPAVRPEVVAASRCAQADKRVIDAFHWITAPLIDRMCANENESKDLAAIRDLLLPKLISGEIRVRNDEKLAEVAL
jgi:type I restriction enzyme S subunit